MDIGIDLPDDPAELLRAALGELKARLNEGWKPSATPWVSAENCTVCLAGAVIMADDCYAKPSPVTICVLSDFSIDDKTYDKLYALELFRMGEIHKAFISLGKELPPQIPAVIDVAPISVVNKFISDMNRIADMLDSLEQSA